MTATPDRAGSGLHGIILIDKEPGWTSHDVVAKARRITGQRKIGHTGTLDPAATGLLVLCLGDATRLVEYMSGHDKRYEGTIALGVTTTTDDAEGDVVERRATPAPGSVDLRALERRFTGRLRQRPPAFSAVSVGGQRAYAAARRGEALDLPEREVVVHDLALEWLADGTLGISLSCGAGTYVRSLARDIGAALGCGGHLISLQRTAAGGFRIEGAVTVPELEAIAASERLVEAVIPADEGMTDYEAALVLDATAVALRNGGRVLAEGGTSGSAALARLYSAGGMFIGVGSVSAAGEIRPVKMLRGAW